MTNRVAPFVGQQRAHHRVGDRRHGGRDRRRRVSGLPGIGTILDKVLAASATCGLCVAVALLALAPAAPAEAAPATVVSLTFDDGNADQMNAVAIMQKAGVKGTFYIISGLVGAPAYMTRANLNTIAAAGSEIGGHTVSHPELTTVSLKDAKREICDGRVMLDRWGFHDVRSFAYPYAAFNASTEGVVKACGFNNARTLGDIASPHSSVTLRSGRIPPADTYDLPAPREIDNTWTLAQMEAIVTDAERVGGWVPFVFHHVCASGCALNITPTTFADFVAWLKTRPATTTVKTVGDVVGGAVKPVVSGPPWSSPTSLRNPSLERANGDVPRCWMPRGWGTHTATWTRTADAHSGGFGEKLDITEYASGDAKLMPSLDMGDCLPSVTPGRTYTIGVWYKSTGASQFALYQRNTYGAWSYWTSSPYFAAAANWTHATWTTPPVPAEAAGMSFGLALVSNGSLTTDDYSLAARAKARGGSFNATTTIVLTAIATVIGLRLTRRHTSGV